MSSTGALRNCYVDSVMGQDPEDVFGARFIQAPHSMVPRPPGAAEGADFSSCNFAPKSFSSSWSAVHPQGIYHPYVHHHHQSHLPASDGRYVGVRSWMDPISNHVPFAGFHSATSSGSASRPYGTKPEVLANVKAADGDPLEAEAPPLPGDCGGSECAEKASCKAHGGGSELSSQSKEEKQQLDPSKLKKWPSLDLQP